jgi:hypothetical protein
MLHICIDGTHFFLIFTAQSLKNKKILILLQNMLLDTLYGKYSMPTSILSKYDSNSLDS